MEKKVENYLHCLNCGKNLSSTRKQELSYCSECILDLNFKITELDHKELDKNLQSILNFFVSDVNAAFNKDPAANTLLEVLTSYPGIKAVLLYRIAHFFFKLGMPFIPRYISDIARELTAIEIHPGAEIGSDFFIDHGAGVVIGETAEIGNNVTIYSGVVLGGTSLERKKRHPTVGNNAVIGTGAKLLGPIKLGDNVTVGANSVVVNDIPSNSIVVGVPGRIVSKKGEKTDKIDLKHGDLPDPVATIVSNLNNRITEIEKKLLILPDKKNEDNDIKHEIDGGGI